MKVYLKFPWYDGEVYRRVEDNPHEVDVPLEKLPSTAQVVNTLGKRDPVWKLRGESDPARRVEESLNEAELRKFRNMREVLGPATADGEVERLAAENEALRAKLEAFEKAEAEAKAAAEAKAKAEAAKK